MSKNLELWNRVCVTDPKHTKKVSIGARKYTSISPQYQIMKATSEFGVYGETWGIKESNFDLIDMPNETKVLLLNAVFFAPGVQFPISSSCVFGEWKQKKNYNTKEYETVFAIDTDSYKKLETDVTTKALSKLGFNADVFMGMFDKAGYSETAEKVEAFSEKLSLAGLEAELNTIEDPKELNKYYLSNRWISTSQAASEIFNNRRKTLSNVSK